MPSVVPSVAKEAWGGYPQSWWIQQERAGL